MGVADPQSIERRNDPGKSLDSGLDLLNNCHDLTQLGFDFT